MTPFRLLIASLFCFVLALACFGALLHGQELQPSRIPDARDGAGTVFAERGRPSAHSPLKVAIAAYVAGAALDAHLSASCVGAGRCLELNPLYAPVAHSYAGMMAAKLATSAALSSAVWRLRDTHKRVAWALIAALVAGQCVVDVHNWRVGR